jgi:hypothetical protein
VLGRSPTSAAASRQYSGWEVNWSQATHAHAVGLTESAGISSSPGTKYVSCMAILLVWGAAAPRSSCSAFAVNTLNSLFPCARARA